MQLTELDPVLPGDGMKCLAKKLAIVFLGLALSGIPCLPVYGLSRSNLPLATDSGIVSFAGDFAVVMPDRLDGWVYIDNFETNRLASSSCIRSYLHDTGTIPSQPYLMFDSTLGNNRRLAFVGYDDEPAVVTFCTPNDQVAPGRTLFGSIQFDVSPLPGMANGDIELFVSYSSDAREWSIPQAVSSGSHQIAVGPMVGAGFVSFLGRDVAIDNLNIVLGRPLTTQSVPTGGSIQSAIDAAANGAVIDVAPGTYGGNINLRGKAIILRSQAGPETTRLQCDPGQRGFYVPNDNAVAAVIEGFSVVGGQVAQTVQPMGGGILCENSSPFIVNCRILECGAQTGGGVASLGGDPTLWGCLIQDNTASQQGGGLALLQSSNAVLEHCTVLDNSARLGAGLYLQSDSFVTDPANAVNAVRGSVFAFNGASQFAEGGAGVYGTGQTLRLQVENSILSRNSGARGAALLVESAGGFSDDFWHVALTNCTVADNVSIESCIHVTRGRTQIKNCIVWANQGVPLQVPGGQHSVNYSTVQGGYEGDGNLSVSPGFYDPFGAPNRIPDYRLQSNSPCIDAGDFACSVALEPSPHGNRVNMGAFGGSAQATRGARTLHVDINRGSDFGHNGLSRTRAFQHIQRALDVAQRGDAVVVWPGRYSETIEVPDLDLLIQGATDPPTVTGGNEAAFSLTKQQGPDTVLRNMIITQSDPAIYCQYAFPTIANLTVVHNAGGIQSLPPEPAISNCIFWENDWDLWGCEASFSCIEDLKAQSQVQGSFSSDPFFSGVDTGDYRLQSRGGRYDIQSGDWVSDIQTSPCLDRGDPTFCPNGEPLPHGGKINIGAYGGTPYASKTPLGLGFSDEEAGMALMSWFGCLPLTASILDINSAIYLNSISKEGVPKLGSGGIIGR